MHSTVLPTREDVASGVPLAESAATVCPVCGTSELRRPWPRRLPWLAECVACGVRRCDPAPGDAELAAVYGTDCFERFSANGAARDAYHTMQQERAARVLETAERLFPKGRLLDVGCGLGDLLIVGRRRGWTVAGLDRGAEAVATARRRSSATVLEQPLEAGGLPEGEYDLVTCLDVFEHLLDPDDALRRMRALVKPGGGLLLATVNVRSVAARLLGTQWWHYHRDHAWYFHAPALRTLAARAGWEVLECGTSWKAFHLEYIQRVLDTGRAGSFSAVPVRGLSRWLPVRLQRARVMLPEGLLLVARTPAGRAG